MQYPSVGYWGSQQSVQPRDSYMYIYIIFNPVCFEYISPQQLQNSSLIWYHQIANHVLYLSFEQLEFGIHQPLYCYTEAQQQLILPSTRGFREVLLPELCNPLLSGHLGISQTVKALAYQNCWPDMLDTTQQHIRQFRSIRRPSIPPKISLDYWHH